MIQIQKYITQIKTKKTMSPLVDEKGNPTGKVVEERRLDTPEKPWPILSDGQQVALFEHFTCGNQYVLAVAPRVIPPSGLELDPATEMKLRGEAAKRQGGLLVGIGHEWKDRFKVGDRVFFDPTIQNYTLFEFDRQGYTAVAAHAHLIAATVSKTNIVKMEREDAVIEELKENEGRPEATA
jgi:hypothetical protein